MPEVSVIIPVFNAQDYIDACVDSLLAQTMDSLELVFVDDHGTDGSVRRLQERMSAYRGPKTLRLVSTPKNSGPGAARNLGISEAKGEFVAFVDSDDTVDPDFCSSLYQAAVSAGTDLACCDIEMGGKVARNTHTGDKRAFLRHFVSFFTTFLYRRSLIVERGIVFPPSHSAEDTCFLTCSVLAANGIAKVDAPLYHYRLHEGSVTRRRDRSRAAARLSSIRRIRRFAREKGYYRDYCLEIEYLVLKKGWILALRDLILG
ncbi:MAG: glycosyltransferase [Bacteroidales bacterium]|nr:glycosyltransferase [Bacteroidales bacterium]